MCTQSKTKKQLTSKYQIGALMLYHFSPTSFIYCPCIFSSAFILNPHYFVYLGLIFCTFPPAHPVGFLQIWNLLKLLPSFECICLNIPHIFAYIIFLLLSLFTVWPQHLLPFLADTWLSSHIFLQVIGKISLILNVYSPSILWINLL